MSFKGKERADPRVDLRTFIRFNTTANKTTYPYDLGKDLFTKKKRISIRLTTVDVNGNKGGSNNDESATIPLTINKLIYEDFLVLI